ncbi:hypothetical protein O181_082091 [Austropuccinia psidii MF-1]|uniref:Uncharacterized protein n=1 Tax=Austropuccinia psidii MF-1 TaxID=1389203 RepID=A0A9Q3FRX7_9BASI|nr:hypothetical protein [Austropuccinia psidii MF-1]
MGCNTRAVGPLGPFWPKFNGAKGGQPPAHKAGWVPNHKWAHLSRFWPPISSVPKMAKRPSGPKLAIFNPWPLATTSSIPASFPLHSGGTISFTNVLCTKDSGMVHIWYNIPLCTNFSHQSNGDVFRTKLCLSNSSPQIHHPLQRKSFQSFSLAISGGYQKTI